MTVKTFRSPVNLDIACPDAAVYRPSAPAAPQSPCRPGRRGDSRGPAAPVRAAVGAPPRPEDGE